MNKVEYRKRVLMRILSSPFVLLPFIAGATVSLATWALGLEPAAIYWFSSIVAMLMSPGVFITKMLVGSEVVCKDVMEEMQEEANQAGKNELDDLEKALIADGDPRTEKQLRDLRTLVSNFSDSKFSALEIDAMSAVEIMSTVEELFTQSVKHLKQTLDLWNAASELENPKARKPLLEQRENLIIEVEKSIEQLGQNLADIEVMRLSSDPGGDLKKIREQLAGQIKDVETIKTEMNDFKKSIVNQKWGSSTAEFLKAAEETRDK